jgi:hypothetical protein
MRRKKILAYFNVALHHFKAEVRQSIPVMITGLQAVCWVSLNTKAGVLTKIVQGLVSQGKYFQEYKKMYLHDD